MRRSLSLALLLVAWSALPAAAGHGSAAHGSFHARSHFVRHFNHFNGSNTLSFNGSFGSFGFTSFSSNGFSRFGRSGFGGGWGWGLADWDDGGGWSSGGGAPMVIVVAAAPPRAAAEAPAPAETSIQTEAGVTVVRGPGSHHLR
ncbi:MAG TPA: hypothetical protein VMA53_09050 [Stellaceae bacterium]|nr:hypothetical protein [Stellaceae bacterium]